MSYRIEYGKHSKFTIPENGNKWRKVMLVLCFVAAGAVLGFYAVQVVGLQNLLPGDPVVTGKALDALVKNWQNGIPAGEAFTVFCEEIIAHAQILR